MQTNKAGKRIKPNRKMTGDDINFVVSFLDNWHKERSNKLLIWSLVEKLSGFSRPSLASKMEIRNAFKNAKEKCKLEKANQLTLAEVEAMQQKLSQLENEAQRLREGEIEWHTLWQRVVYNASARGIDPESLFAPIVSANRQHTGQTAAAFEMQTRSHSEGRAPRRKSATAKAKDSSPRKERRD